MLLFFLIYYRVCVCVDSKKEIQKKKFSLFKYHTGIATATTVQMQQQQRKHYQQQHELSHALHDEPYCSGQPGSMPIDTIPLPTSVINRSFDNVSPRPYITIEGTFQIQQKQKNFMSYRTNICTHTHAL